MLTGQIGPTIKIILSVQDNLCQTFATVRRTIGMTGIKLILTEVFFILFPLKPILCQNQILKCEKYH
jgi:hypothetical protein